METYRGEYSIFTQPIFLNQGEQAILDLIKIHMYFDTFSHAAGLGGDYDLIMEKKRKNLIQMMKELIMEPNVVKYDFILLHVAICKGCGFIKGLFKYKGNDVISTCKCVPKPNEKGCIPFVPLSANETKYIICDDIVDEAEVQKVFKETKAFVIEKYFKGESINN